MIKKAQIKFGETFAIIFIVFLIVMIGGLWYNNIMTSEVQDMREEQQREEALIMFSYMTNDPFVRDTRMGYVEGKMNLDSIEAFHNFSNSEEGVDYLRPRIGEGIATIEVYNRSTLHEVDGDVVAQEQYTLYNYTSPSTQDVMLSGGLVNWESFTTFVQVYDPNKEETNIARLNVRVPITP